MYIQKVKDILIQQLVLLRNFRPNKQVLIFLCCVLISLTFWLLRALDKPIRGTLAFPIVVKNIPKGYELSSAPAPFIKVEVEDLGFNILSYRFSQSLYATVLDVEKIGFSTNSGRGYMLVKNLEGSLKKQLHSSTKLISISPDSLNFVVSRREIKEVPVAYKDVISYAPQCIGYGYEVNPSSIEISGFQELLDTIDTVYISQQNFKPLKDSLVRNVSLQEIKGVKFSKKRVQLTLPVEAYTEIILELPVRGVNVPDSFVFRPIPGVVSVKFNSPLSVEINPEDFLIEADYSMIYKDSTVSTFLPLQISRVQDKIFNTQVYPSEIEYVLEKKNEW